MKNKIDFELSQNIAKHLIAKAQIEFNEYLIHLLKIAKILDDSNNLDDWIEAVDICRFVAENRIKEHFIYD